MPEVLRFSSAETRRLVPLRPLARLYRCDMKKRQPLFRWQVRKRYVALARETSAAMRYRRGPVTIDALLHMN
jgi:hypothetical protein